MAGVGHSKRTCKDAYSVAGALQETCSSEMLGGQGADFLRRVAFWSIRSSGLLRWFCVTGAALRMTWHHFFVAGKNALVRGSQLCTQLSIFEGGLAEFFRLWCCQLRKMRKSRRIASFFWRCQVEILRKSRRTASFLMLSSLKNDEVSQNSLVFKLEDR